MIDSHCHLDHEPLLSDIDNVIERSKSAGITKILTICTTLNSFDKIKKLVLKDKIIYGTYGIHPHETKNDIVNSDLIINEIHEQGQYEIIWDANDFSSGVYLVKLISVNGVYVQKVILMQL